MTPASPDSENLVVPAIQRSAALGDGGSPTFTFTLTLSGEAVQALYVHLFHRNEPAWGWIEAPLKAIEKALEPINTELHAEGFAAMDDAFWGRS